MSDDEIIWKSTLDRRYVVAVTRTGLYRAELTISDGGQVLHREIVGLMYDAIFGPDVSDVLEWKRIAVEFIDRNQQ